MFKFALFAGLIALSYQAAWADDYTFPTTKFASAQAFAEATVGYTAALAALTEEQTSEKEMLPKNLYSKAAGTGGWAAFFFTAKSSRLLTNEATETTEIKVAATAAFAVKTGPFVKDGSNYAGHWIAAFASVKGAGASARDTADVGGAGWIMTLDDSAFKRGSIWGTYATPAADKKVMVSEDSAKKFGTYEVIGYLGEAASNADDGIAIKVTSVALDGDLNKASGTVVLASGAYKTGGTAAPTADTAAFDTTTIDYVATYGNCASPTDSTTLSECFAASVNYSSGYFVSAASAVVVAVVAYFF